MIFMEIGKCVNLLRDMARLGEVLMCTSCGTETPSIYTVDLCSNCENLIYASRKTLAGRDPELVGNLDAIRESVEAGKFEHAIAVYSKMNESASLLYAEAIAYMKYSNREAAKVRLAAPGEAVIEGNAAIVEKSDALASMSKSCLAKAAWAAKNEIEDGASSLGAAYMTFLTQLRFGAVKAANEALKRLEKAGNAYVAGYANLAFDASTGRYDEVLKRTDQMMIGEHGINVFYYLAFALFKKSRMEESAALLNELQQVSKSANVGALLHEIELLENE